jgi:hypothetical protein
MDLVVTIEDQNLQESAETKECCTVDAELKRNAKAVIDKILHLRDSL